MTDKNGTMFETGPYLQIAAFCERILREGDGVLSLIRVVDRITHQVAGPDAPRDMPEIRYPLTLAIVLKSGRARGRHELSITPQLPSGELLQPMAMTVQLEGENRGVSVVNVIDIPYRQEGLYWFTIAFDGQTLTRLPLEIRYSRLVTGTPTERQ